MKRLFFPLSVLLLLFLFPSCNDDNQLRIVSFRDPDFYTVSYKKVCLLAYVGDIQARQNFEFHVANFMRMSGLNIYEGINFMPPTRNWSIGEMRDVLLKNGFDGCLVLDITDRKTITYQMPGEKKVSGNSNSGKTISETPPYEFKMDYISLQAKMIDVNSTNTAWISQAKFTGERQIFIGMISNPEFRKKFAEKLVETVLRDRIISANANNTPIR